jgi:two-component system KDP operon response regulator KdpE
MNFVAWAARCLSCGAFTQPLTHQKLLVWGPNHGEDTHHLRVYMGHAQIERDPAQPRHLLTETAIGYRFVP